VKRVRQLVIDSRETAIENDEGMMSPNQHHHDRRQAKGLLFASPPPPQPPSGSHVSSAGAMMPSSTSSSMTTPSVASAIMMDSDDVSMGENSSVMSNTVLPSSPPRTVLRSRRGRPALGGAADIHPAAGSSSSFRRSRLFAENDEDDADDNNGAHDGRLPSPIPRRSLEPRRNLSILEPLDLNLDTFSSQIEGRPQTYARGGAPAAAPGAMLESRPLAQEGPAAAAAGVPGAPDPDKTPRRNMSGVVRKRQAESHDMSSYRDRSSSLGHSHNQPLDSSFDGSVGTNGDDNEQQPLYFPVESPVDMYTSPQLSPSSSSSSSLRLQGRTSTSTAASFYRSPLGANPSGSLFYQRQRPGAAHSATSHFNKSPCYRTLDGRTVQSKNPFSPMITSSANSTPNHQQYTTGNATKMDTCSSTPSSESPLSLSFQNSFMDESITLPSSLPGGKGATSSGGGVNGGVLLRRKLPKRTGFNHNIGIVGGVGGATAQSEGSGPLLGLDGMVVPVPVPSADAADPAASWLYTRDGYPEKTGRYSFTGSPIREQSNDASSASHDVTSMASHVPTSTDPDVPHRGDEIGAASYHHVGTNSIHKVRRHTKGEDVAAAAAHGEQNSWKRPGMRIYTQHTSSLKPLVNPYGGPDGLGGADDHDDESHPTKSGAVRKEDISPTDVLSFPFLRASPSNTSSVPPTPMKPVRRPAVKRYTPIRRPLVPPTPLPRTRKARSFDDDEMFVDETGRGEGTSIDYLNLSPGDPPSRPGSGHGHRQHHRHQHHRQLVVAPPPAPPSRFYSDFDVIGELGNGSFGNVFKVLSRLDGCMYAIKVAHRPAKGMADKDRMLKEVYALAALSDQADTATFHIVRYHQAWMEDQRLYIQTELCTTTLHAEMQQVAPSALPIERRYKCLREILLALEYIHKNGMVHLDIKPENIFVRPERCAQCITVVALSFAFVRVFVHVPLLTVVMFRWHRSLLQLKNDQFKLGDFGLVSKVSSHDVEEGDSRYMSVELLSGDHADLTKSDIFSLGISMYEVCLGGSKLLPSNGPEWQSLRSGSVAPLPGTSPELHSIIQTMMNPVYRERPSATELLTRPQLLSDEQKLLMEERNKVYQANLALVAQSNRLRALTPAARKGALVRANTWNGSF
jgi:wee1-like protein kinase